MRSPPSYTQLPKFPVIAGPMLAAIGVSIAFWLKQDIARLELGPEIADGQVWRLFTSTLPHANIFHLLFNLAWFWIFGTLLVEVWGSLRTALVCALLAAGSMGAEYAVFDGGIGLSGVGYGLFGLIWSLGRFDRRFAGVVDQKTVSLFVIWFFLCILTTVLGIMPVANVAHGMGLVLGFVLGEMLGQPYRARRIGAFVVEGLLIAAIVVGMTVGRPYVNLSSQRGAQEAYLAYKSLTDGRNDDGIKWGRRAVRLNPKDQGAWTNLGVAYHRAGQAAEAEAAWEKASALPQGLTPKK